MEQERYNIELSSSELEAAQDLVSLAFDHPGFVYLSIYDLIRRKLHRTKPVESPWRPIREVVFHECKKLFVKSTYTGKFQYHIGFLCTEGSLKAFSFQNDGILFLIDMERLGYEYMEIPQ